MNKWFLAALLWLLPAVALAQSPPAAQPVYGFPNETTILTLTAHAAGTANSSDQVMYGRGVYCTFNQSAHTGTPSTTFAIQSKDAASSSYETLLTSAAITADATPSILEIYPGVQTSSLPSGLAALNLSIPKKWRVEVIVGGTTPVVTATVDCSTLP